MNDVETGSSLRPGVALIGSDDDVPAALDFGGGPLPGAARPRMRGEPAATASAPRTAPGARRSPASETAAAAARLTEVHIGPPVTLHPPRPARAIAVPIGVAVAGLGVAAYAWMMLSSAPLAVLSGLLGMVGGLLCWVAMHE
jgi:hypothetical protein